MATRKASKAKAASAKKKTKAASSSSKKKAAAKRPAAKKPVAKRPAAKKPSSKKSAATKSSSKKSAAKKPSSKKSAAKRPAAAPTKARAGGAKRPAVRVDVDALVVASAEARQAAWSAWGTVEPDVITHLLNPSLMGGPRWPAMRQAYRVARAGTETLIASDGLSDPFDDGSRNGFGLEIFAVTDEPLEKAAPSWLFDAVWQMSQFCAQHGGVADLLDELKLVTTELYGVKLPDEHAPRFVNDAGRVAVLLGMQPAGRLPFRIDGPLSPIRLVNLKLLTLPELAFVLQGGDGARAELARRFDAQGSPLRSSLTRDSVV